MSGRQRTVALGLRLSLLRFFAPIPTRGKTSWTNRAPAASSSSTRIRKCFGKQKCPNGHTKCLPAPCAFWLSPSQVNQVPWQTYCSDPCFPPECSQMRPSKSLDGAKGGKRANRSDTCTMMMEPPVISQQTTCHHQLRTGRCQFLPPSRASISCVTSCRICSSVSKWTVKMAVSFSVSLQH